MTFAKQVPEDLLKARRVAVDHGVDGTLLDAEGQLLGQHVGVHDFDVVGQHGIERDGRR